MKKDLDTILTQIIQSDGKTSEQIYNRVKGSAYSSKEAIAILDGMEIYRRYPNFAQSVQSIRRSMHW